MLRNQQLKIHNPINSLDIYFVEIIDNFSNNPLVDHLYFEALPAACFVHICKVGMILGGWYTKKLFNSEHNNSSKQKNIASLGANRVDTTYALHLQVQRV